MLVSGDSLIVLCNLLAVGGIQQFLLLLQVLNARRSTYVVREAIEWIDAVHVVKVASDESLYFKPYRNALDQCNVN